MNNFVKQNLLQLFSDGEGAAAGLTGVNSAADAGQQGHSDSGERAKQPRDAAASGSEAPHRMTWDEIMADPEYNARMQETVRKRLNSGRDPQSQTFEEAARDGFRSHFRELERQGEALKATFPGFDLRRELSNPAFARMTAPDVGIRVEDAYYALHRQQIQSAAMQVTAQKTAQMIADGIRSGSLRPVENGTAPQGATVLAFDYRAASPQQRSALKKRIREASIRGVKLYPGR